MKGRSQNHWQHVWPAANVLAQFVSANHALFVGTVVLELGAGATGVVGLVAGKVGAKRVVLTDHPQLDAALQLLRRNVETNGLSRVCEVQGLDWDSLASIDVVLSSLSNGLHFVLASDVFYDPCVFTCLVRTFSRILDAFPKAMCYFSFQERDDRWSIEEHLKSFGLRAVLVRSVESSGHTCQIGLIYKRRDSAMFAGIEGGGSFSKLVFLDSNGEAKGFSESSGTNYYLNGIEKTADHLASWIRKAALENGVTLPLKALGMGLSGAEDELLNEKLVEYLHTFHGDIAEKIYLTSDGIATIAATFEQGGVVIIAGTGSTVRLLLPDGKFHGVGGWGHMVGDGGSGYWIASHAIRILFDDDDGLKPAGASTNRVRELLLQHFDITDKVGILDYLYAKFDKSRVATFTETLAKNADDPLIQRIFADAGSILAHQLVAVSRRMPKEMLANVDIVMIGSVFKSWSLLREGFMTVLKESAICRVNLYKLTESAAFGAACLAAKQLDNTVIPRKQQPVVVDTIDL